ncbi:uncharacterized protein ACRADG_009733 [Cochliomyia hominivorax]
MGIQMKLILFTIVCTFLGTSCAEDKCKACGDVNLAYCVDKSSYYFCLDNKPMKTKLQKCKDDHVCTNSIKICEPESEQYKPLCSTSCNKCPSNGHPYTCVSKTEYARCINGKVAFVDSCNNGSFCNVDLLSKAGEICAPQCVLDFFGLSPTCKNDEQITTTVPPPPTANIETLKDKCKNHPSYQDKEKNYYYIGNVDDNCKTYIYCEKFKDDVEAVLMRCSKGFYDESSRKCVDKLTKECGVN